MDPSGDIPATSARPRAGRRLGGVCLMVARRSGLPVGRVRLAFVLGTFVVLLGPLAYLALLLVVPSDGGAAQAPGLRAVVLAAQLVAAAIAGVALAALGAGLAVFGLGWVVVAVAAASTLLAATRWRMRVPAWLLPALVALTAPASAAALLGVSLRPSLATVSVAPGALRAGLHARSSFGPLRVDLRRTDLPASGTVTLDLEAGTARTIVALPHDRCVHVEVERRAPSERWSRLGSGLAHAPVTLFDRSTRDYGTSGALSGHGLNLRIRFSSYDAGLVVRDYPDGIVPWEDPGWPGEYYVEPPPYRDPTLSRHAYAELVRGYRARRPAELARRARVQRERPGPCG